MPEITHKLRSHDEFRSLSGDPRLLPLSGGHLARLLGLLVGATLWSILSFYPLLFGKHLLFATFTRRSVDRSRRHTGVVRPEHGAGDDHRQHNRFYA